MKIPTYLPEVLAEFMRFALEFPDEAARTVGFFMFGTALVLNIIFKERLAYLKSFLGVSGICLYWTGDPGLLFVMMIPVLVLTFLGIITGWLVASLRRATFLEHL